MLRSPSLTLAILTAALFLAHGTRASAQAPEGEAPVGEASGEAMESPPEELTATEGARDDDAVRALLADAVAEYDAARYPEALALFRRAHEIAPTARTLRGIGMASFESGRYVAALRALRASLLSTERPLTEALRQHVRRLIERTEVFVATLTLDVSPPGARVQIDGVDVVYEDDGTVLLDPGRHVVRVSGGAGSQSLEVNLEGGSRRSAIIRADSLASATVDPLVITGATVLIAGGLTGVAALATGLVALELQGQLERECTAFFCPGAQLATRDRALELALATDIILASAGALAITGLVFLVAGATSAPPPPISIACGPGGCSVSAEGTF